MYVYQKSWLCATQAHYQYNYGTGLVAYICISDVTVGCYIVTMITVDRNMMTYTTYVIMTSLYCCNYVIGS